MPRPLADLEMTTYRPEVVPAVIASGQSLSPAVDLDGVQVVGIQMPAAWTAAALTFQASADGVTYADLYDDAGVEVSVTAAQGRYIAIPATRLVGVRFLKARSGTGAAPVNQAADRTLLLVGRVV